MISVIVPVLNEAATILSVIERCQNASVELIIVDGGSTDETVVLAQQAGATVLIEKGGRAAQQNAGARAARGDIFLFLHADTLLPDDFVENVETLLANPHMALGAFHLRIAGNDWRLKLVTWGANLRSKIFHLPYGDQALFLRRDIFWTLSGFQRLPIMEDFDLVRRARRYGKVGLVRSSVITSPRRWQRLGIFRTTVINQIILAGYALGIAPERLAHFYRRHRHTRS